MKGSSAKENILKKVRQALANPVPVPFPHSEGVASVFKPQPDDLALVFAENFTGLQGRFFFCIDVKELAEQLQTLTSQNKLTNIYINDASIKSTLTAHGFSSFTANDVSTCHAAITGCELLIARTGSIVLSAAKPGGRTVSIYTPVHICIAYTSQLVYDIKESLQLLKEKYKGRLPSLITLATGPSRTADIEKTLVVGVHGPKEVYVFLVDDES